MTTYQIQIAPEILFPTFWIKFYGLPDVGTAHPTKPYLRVIPREVSFTPGAELLKAPAKMLNWLKLRYSQADLDKGADKLFADTDKDGLTQFEEFAYGAHPARNEGGLTNTTMFPSESKMAFEHHQNLESTDINHEVQVGNGIVWRAAKLGVDYTLADLTGTGMVEYIQKYGLVNKKVTVLKNSHSWKAKPDLCFIRVKISQEIIS